MAQIICQQRDGRVYPTGLKFLMGKKTEMIPFCQLAEFFSKKFECLGKVFPLRKETSKLKVHHLLFQPFFLVAGPEVMLKYVDLL